MCFNLAGHRLGELRMRVSFELKFVDDARFQPSYIRNNPRKVRVSCTLREKAPRYRTA